jgi:hypothetical protein
MSDKFENALALIRSGTLSRSALLTMRDNAESLRGSGDGRAQEIIDAINTQAVPVLEREYVFMGYCEGADIENRSDEEWVKNGVCKFRYVESEPQLKRFCDICAGDTIILKKREKFGETMLISYFGKVTHAADAKITNLPYLLVDWKKPAEELIVPLMGCNATVNVRSLDLVEKEMPKDFWEWLAS